MRYTLIILTILISACDSKKETEPVIAQQASFFKAIAANDIALNPPREGEWRYDHNEPGQTLEQYKNARFTRLTDSAHTIFIQPLGTFSVEQQHILEYTAQYIEIFFQLKVQLMQPIADSIVPATARRTRSDGTIQLNAPYILDTLLKHKLPAHAIVLMTMTEKDLYPQADWNFIFGLASYQQRVGVSSIKRLYRNLKDTTNFKKCLERAIAITSHEIGHMFSMHHCVNARCVMNGSNSLAETDLQPNRLCAECLKKLYWNLRFDNTARLKALLQYFDLHGLQRDYLMAKDDWEQLN